MCCIIFRPVDAKEIDKNNIESIIDINKDGWGISYMMNGVLKVHRSMDMKTALDFIRKLEKDNIEFLFHARKATKGEKRVDNCHPYFIHNGCLFHNGTMKIPLWKIDMSDTWHFSKKMTKYIKKNRTIEWILNKFKIEINDSRLAVMTKDGDIHLHGNWIEIEGCKYSKVDWRYKTNNYSYGYSNYEYNNETWKHSNNKREIENGNFKIEMIKDFSHSQLLELVLNNPTTFSKFIIKNIKELKELHFPKEKVNDYN